MVCRSLRLQPLQPSSETPTAKCKQLSITQNCATSESATHKSPEYTLQGRNSTSVATSAELAVPSVPSTLPAISFPWHGPFNWLPSLHGRLKRSACTPLWQHAAAHHDAASRAASTESATELWGPVELMPSHAKRCQAPSMQ